MAQKKRGQFYIGLVHFPVYNKHRKIVVTAITNYDIHDISRAAVTYAVDGFYVITPLQSQQKLAQRIIGYWKSGPGRQLNYTRTQSLEKTYVVDYVQTALNQITERRGKKPLLVGTSARVKSHNKRLITVERLRALMQEQDVFVIFGTGWGMSKQLLAKCDYILPAIKGPSPYNHLSVRSAVSIILDRLRGNR